MTQFIAIDLMSHLRHKVAEVMLLAKDDQLLEHAWHSTLGPAGCSPTGAQTLFNHLCRLRWRPVETNGICQHITFQTFSFSSGAQVTYI